MATLETKKIRARISSPIGTVETPYIQSFYVNRTRNQLDSCNCSVKIKNKPGNAGDGKLTIEAGSDGTLYKVFSGYIVATKIRPCFEDPEYTIVDISATDSRKYLEGRTFTRRQKDEKDTWVEITGVARRALKSSKLKYTRRSEFQQSVFPAPADQNSSEADTSSADVVDILRNLHGTSKASNRKNGFIELSATVFNGEQ